MSLVQRDDVVEQLTAAASHPALSHSVLPRTSNRRSHRRNVHRFDGGGYCESVLRVVIEYQEPGDRLVRKACASSQLCLALKSTTSGGRQESDLLSLATMFDLFGSVYHLS